jgi:trimethylamine--corrinoid protein Co-methyltransferase
MAELETVPQPAPARNRGGGRQSRQAQRGGARAQPIIAGIDRQIPTYELLGEEGLARVEAAIDVILKEVGIDFRGDDRALELWRDAGADVQGERVRFDLGLVRGIITRTAPKRFTHHARNPARSVEIGESHLVFAPAYGSPFVHDFENGRRYGAIEDFRNFVKLAYMSPWLHHSGGTVCERGMTRPASGSHRPPCTICSSISGNFCLISAGSIRRARVPKALADATLRLISAMRSSSPTRATSRPPMRA